MFAQTWYPRLAKTYLKTMFPRQFDTKNLTNHVSLDARGQEVFTVTWQPRKRCENYGAETPSNPAKHYVNSFQTTITPNPEKFYKYHSVAKQEETLFECALQMLSISGAGGLVTLHYDAIAIITIATLL